MYREDLQQQYNRKKEQLERLRGKYPYCMERRGWPNIERCRLVAKHDGDHRFRGSTEIFDLKKLVSKLELEVKQLYLMLLPNEERREII